MHENWYMAMKLVKIKNEAIEREMRNGLWLKHFSEEKRHHHRRNGRH